MLLFLVIFSSKLISETDTDVTGFGEILELDTATDAAIMVRPSR